MESAVFEKSKIYTIKDMNHHDPKDVVIKNILKKETGKVVAIFVEPSQEITEKLSRFDHFILIVDGNADVFIDENSFSLTAGQCIIIPANSKNTIHALERCQIISTIIKSGYE